jgi:hypothetical protein
MLEGLGVGQGGLEGSGGGQDPTTFSYKGQDINYPVDQFWFALRLLFIFLPHMLRLFEMSWEEIVWAYLWHGFRPISCSTENKGRLVEGKN